MNEKTKAAGISVFSNTSLVIFKLITGFITGSVSILSEAIHSAMDLLAAVIAFFAVRISDTPADKGHPYGHGKYENVSGIIEALLILLASGWIIYEAVVKILHPGPIESIGLGSVVMFVSAVANFFVSRYLYKVAKKTDSIALEADALHLKTDVYTSLGVAIGLLLIWATGWHFLDSVIAVFVATLIVKEAVHLLRAAYAPLLDASLSESEVEVIKDSIKSHNLSFHALRTRKAGHYRFAELHLEVAPDISVGMAHEMCDMIEKDIMEKIKNIEVSIHVEPLSS
ncbi:MAG TPA: cation diffusion facilitator family transporter [Bacteroidales bacterium]|nr:cation diffusion facilitator family transporter [Bacteroidales bacterium]